MIALLALGFVSVDSQTTYAATNRVYPTACKKTKAGFIKPSIISRWHEECRLPVVHMGTDIGIPKKTPLYAVCTGKVVSQKYGNNGGYQMTISCDDDQTSAFYAHMFERTSLKQGDKVLAGQKIGISGDTGTAKGIPHLHFGRMKKDTNGDLQYFNPEPELKEWKCKG